MRTHLAAVIVTGLVVSGCGFGQSRLNPVNWFGKSTEIDQPVVDEGTVNPLMPEERNRNGLLSGPEAVDNSVLIQSVSDLRIEPTSSGAIVYAQGRSARQGAYSATLRPRPSESGNGVLTLEFRVLYPNEPTSAGTEVTRTVHAAQTLSVDELAALSKIRVVAAQNARETRRK